jgi:hypothetical protein
MSRVSIPVGQSIKLFDTGGRRQGVSVQNVSSVDIYYTADQRLLDSVSAANLPTAGNLLPATSPVSPPVIYPWIIGARYARAQNTGAQIEVDVWDVDPCG